MIGTQRDYSYQARVTGVANRSRLIDVSKAMTSGIEENVQVRVQQEPATENRKERKKQPRYSVILWDDDDHTYEYVIQMMRKLFGYPDAKAYEIASCVDTTGKAVCLTTTMEHAELKRDQIHAFGADARLARCQGAMSATIEPIE